MRVMGRIRRVVVIVGIVAFGLAGSAGSASAQTSPVPTTAADADTFPVLQTADLPTGHRMSSGTPLKRTGISAQYPSVTECVWNFQNPFSGLTPTIYQSSFYKTADITGQSTAIEFDAAKPATAFYGNFEEAYAAAAKCKMSKVRSTSSGEIVSYGKVKLFDPGKIGDDAFGATVTPSASFVPLNHWVVFRTGDTVGYVRVNDDDMTTKEIAKLAKVAEQRAS